MKKILMVISTLFILFGVQNSYAQTYKLTLEKQKDIYYVRKGDVLPYKSSQYSIYKLGNNIAYCIEPKNNITTFNYVENGAYIDLDYSEELKERLELIGYYGREFPGHDTVYFSMATQALIWELTGTGQVSFWTAKDGQGESIDITKEKDEIIRLVNKHQNIPNLGENINGYLNKEIVLEDVNQVLKDFEISNMDENIVSIKDNQLIIIPKKVGESIITLKRKRYDANKTILFIGSDKNNSQTLARLRFNKEIEYNLKINIQGSKIKINKVDENNNKLAIQNIKFKIRDLKTGEMVCENSDCQFVTNKFGEVITNTYLSGSYEIEEVEDQIIKGYTWNSERKIIDINSDSNIKWDNEIGNYIEINYENKSVRGILELFKKGEEYYFDNNEIVYKKVDLSNIEFYLYNEKDVLIDVIRTNENGYAKYDGLMVGKYYLVEKTELDNYVHNKEKHFFEIEQINQYNEVAVAKVEIDNILKKGTLVFNKVDNKTGIGISNTIMEIYNASGELLLTKETNEDGIITVADLPTGKYYLMEKEANKMYQLTNEKILFEIKENNEIVRTSMTNERIEIFVPKTGRDDNTFLNILCSFIFFIGLGDWIYEKRKTH